MTHLKIKSLRVGASLLLSTCLISAFIPNTFGPAFAQDAVYDLDEITLSTDRAGSDALDVAANVTVVGEGDIQDHQINDMQELVRNVPGVEVSRQTSGADPFSTFGGFSIRGVGGNRVAIQLDGSRVAERIIDGTRDYLDFNFTKQVEIMRGPASVLWGADALGGLVAIQTIDPEDILDGKDRAVQFSTGYDSFDRTTRAALSFGQQLSPNLSLLVGVSREEKHEPKLSNARNDGGIYGCPRNVSFGATPCGEFDPTSTQSTRGLAKLVWTPTSDHRVEFSADVLQRETNVAQNYGLGPVVSSFTGIATGEVINSKTRHLDLSRKRFAIEHTYTPEAGVFSEIRSTLAYTPHSYSRTGVENSTSSAGDQIVEYDSLNFSEDFLELDVQATANFSLGRTNHRVIFGFDGDITKTDYARRDITNNLTTGITTEKRGGGFNFANATTRRADLYVEDLITFGDGRFELTPGLRYATFNIDPRPDADYQPVIGQEPVVRKDQALLKSLGAVYHINDNWSVWGKYGEGFKMPTAQQLYTSLPGTYFSLTPAPGLDPEEVKSYELGLRFEKERGFFAINAFKSDYSNFIQSFYNPPGTNEYTYRNLSTVDIYGIEASGGWAISDRTSMGFSAAWQEGTQRVNPTSTETAHTLPPLTGTVSVKHYLPNQRVSLEGVTRFASAVTRTSSASKFKPKGYALLDLYAKWEVVDNGFLSIGVQNAFDTRYFTANAASYNTTASSSVASTNPLELQTGPGRVFSVSYDMKF